MSDVTNAASVVPEKPPITFTIVERVCFNGCSQCEEVVRTGKYVCVVFEQDRPHALMGVDRANPPICPNCCIPKPGFMALWETPEDAYAATRGYEKVVAEAVAKALVAEDEEGKIVKLGDLFSVLPLPDEMQDPLSYARPQ
jgi:hypothetical protein